MIVVTGLQAPDLNKQVKCIIIFAVNYPQLPAVDATGLMNSTADYQASLIFLENISALPYQQDPTIAAFVWVGPANRFTNCVEMELQVMYIRTVMERWCFYTVQFNRLLDLIGSKHI